MSRKPLALLLRAVVLICVVAGMQQAAAQTHVWTETRFPFSTLEQNIGMPLGIIRAVEFGAEGAMHLTPKTADHRWNVAVGGALELIGGERWNLQFETVVNLVVDPGNDIGFNPRAFIWHEALVVTRAAGEQQWQVGYVHRCKHDVDNLELYETTGIYEQRSIMLGSVMARWRRLPIEVAGWGVRPLVQADAFILRQDQRFPVATRELVPKANENLASLRAALEVERQVMPRVRVGAAFDARATVAAEEVQGSGSETLRWDGSVELFATVLGDARNVRIFVRHEEVHDTLLRTDPRPASLTSIGLRLMP